MRTALRDAEPGAKGDDRTIGAGALPARPHDTVSVGQAGHTQRWVQMRQVHGKETGQRLSWKVNFLVRIMIKSDDGNQGQTQRSCCWAGSRSGLLWVGD